MGSVLDDPLPGQLARKERSTAAVRRLRTAAMARRRAIVLLVLVVAIIAAAYCVDHAFDQGEVYRRIFYPRAADRQVGPEWQHLVQALILLLGIPAAYLLWHWRDQNTRAGIENARKDTNLREFQELQLRAAGGVGSDDDKAVAQTLQIAALHQMRSFLKGEYGEGFRRPAFELYCALLARPKAVKTIRGRPEDEGAEDAEDQADEVALPLAPSVFRAIRDIVKEDWQTFFYGGYSLNNRSFRDLDLSDVNLKHLTFVGTDFSGGRWAGVVWCARAIDCRMDDMSFTNCNLFRLGLSNCSINNVSFENVYGEYFSVSETNGNAVTFDRCRLHSSVFEKSRIDQMKFIGCDLRWANLSGLNSYEIDATGTTVNEATKLCDVSIYLPPGVLSDLPEGGHVEGPPILKWRIRGAIMAE